MPQSSTSTAAKPFRIAFIGTGGIALHQMKYLKSIPGVEIIAVADVNEKALTKVKDQHHIERAYADYHKMLRDVPEIDAVSVCTPNGLHAENAIAALDAGKHVLVEKPMAMTAREATKMVEAAKRAGKQLIVGFQHRFEPRSKMHPRPGEGRGSSARCSTSAARRCAAAGSRAGASSAARTSRAAGR